MTVIHLAPSSVDS